MSDSGKYSGFGYPDIRVPVEITTYDTYCSTPWRVNYVYDTKECIALLVLKDGSANMVCHENKSAVSQCCRVSVLQYFHEYSCICFPVIYIHTEYQYKGGYYGSCSLYPIEGIISGPLLITAVFQADLQVFFQHKMGLTLSPSQVYVNYCKDLLVNQYHGYEQYMGHVIDVLAASVEVDWKGSQDTSREIFIEQTQDAIPVS